MKEKRILDILGKVDEKYIEEADHTKRTRKSRSWLKWGAMAACLCLIIGTAVTGILRWSLLPGNDVVHEPEQYTSVAWEDVTSTEPFGALFPTQIIEGYELEGEVALYGEGTDGVMEARFYNEQLSDELVITVYAKGHYGNETLNEIIRGDGHNFTGNRLTVDGGDYVVRYITGREITEISDFENMVKSAQAFSSNGAILSDYPPLVMIDEKLYQDSGKVASDAKNDKQDGQISSVCEGLPTENNQSNFGTGYAWQYGENDTIYVQFETGWFAFIPVND